LLAAAQALEFHAPLGRAAGTEAALQAVRRLVPRLEDDRVLAPDLETLARPETLRAIVRAAEDACGAPLANTV